MRSYACGRYVPRGEYLTDLRPIVMIGVMSDAEAADFARDRDVVPGLYWGVRESFIAYVAGNPDGQVYGDGGVETDGEGTFRFPLASAAGEGASWRIAFAGVVRFVAHGGMLDVMLAEPVLELGGEVGALVVTHGEQERRILEVESAPPVEIDGAWLVFPPLATTLTADGSHLFGDVYPPGEPFDPLQVALPVERARS